MVTGTFSQGHLFYFVTCDVFHLFQLIAVRGKRDLGALVGVTLNKELLYQIQSPAL